MAKVKDYVVHCRSRWPVR